MNRLGTHRLARWLALFLLVTAACATRPPLVTPAAHPNIVLIVAEDLSPRLGAYGDPIARTPRIDTLAREGVRFSHAYTTAPVCAPSRAALITGRYAQEIGAQHMRTTRGWDEPGVGHSFKYLAVPPPDVKAFPELLRRTGYFTVNHAKTDYQFGEPFTIWDVSDGSESEFPWRAAPRDQPFFAMISPQTTHESRIWASESIVTDANRVTVPPYLADTPVTRRDIARHYDDIAALDSQVGEILDALEDDGLLENTIVIFTTDHGDGLPHAKRRLYDAGLHVPLIVRFPDGRAAGTLRSDLVSFVDLAPMILNFAGVESAPPPVREYVFAAADRMDKVPGYWRSVRDQRFQYLVNHMPERPLLEHLEFRDRMPSMQELWRLHAAGGLTPLQESQFTAPREPEELYDLYEDPDQTRNIARDPSYFGDLERLRNALARFETSTPDLSRMTERKMAEQMWPGLVQPRTAKPVTAGWFGTGTSRLQLRLSCPTVGASIGYRLTSDPPNRWRVYADEILLAPGTSGEAKAVRYGYAESEVTPFSMPDGALH